MKKISACTNCGSREQRIASTQTGGVKSSTTNLLPGAGGWLTPATLQIVVCLECGLTRLFADSEAVTNLRNSDLWERT